MINFALIQLTKKHTEIFGTFIEIILKNKWNLTIYCNLESDEYTFVKYYKSLFFKDLQIKHTSFLSNDTDIFDYFIFATASDDNKIPDIFKKSELSNRCIYIQHQASQYKHFMLKNITVSPVIKSPDLSESNPEMILPIYKSYKKLHWKPSSKTTIFAVIGGIRCNPAGKVFDRNLDLITDLLNKYPDGDYEFWFFMRKWDWLGIIKKFKFLKEHPKIFGFAGLDTEELIKSLHRVKYILPLGKKKGWFYWERLTGSIPLAINFNIPLILDKELAQIYGLEDYSFCYENNLIEIYDKIMEINNDEYFKLIENSVIYKKKKCRENEKNFINICIKKIAKQSKIPSS